MPGSSSRDALAARLEELRMAAGLSGNALADRMKVVQSRVWKIGNARLMPTEKDIRAWASVTGRDDLADDLIAMMRQARAEQEFAAEFRRSGPAVYQETVQAIEAEATRIGEYQPAVIPGLLQTAEYARELMSLPAGLRAWGGDEAAIRDTVDARMRRQEAVLHDPDRRIQIVLGEGALRTRVVTPPTLARQLGTLISLARLPAVELGIIAFDRPMPTYPLGFRVYDDDLAVVESIVSEDYFTAETKPDQVAAFLEAFGELRQAASTGDEAEAIIRQVLEDLR
jgi:transcriptional regulator with XRE-family HTH domain